MRSIPFSPPDISELEINEVVEALKSGWITTGPRTKKLEERLAAYCHTQKCVCLSSATAAEELNLRVLGIGEGDEVIVPAYTYTASVSAAVHVGAKVVFIAAQPDSVEMDYDQMEAAINEKTKAISSAPKGTARRQERSRILPAFPSTLSRISPQPRAALPHGERLTALTTKKSTSSFSYTACTVRARTPLPKPSRAPGNTTSSVRGTSAI